MGFLTYGLLCPFFPLGILGPFACLGLPRPLLLILYSMCFYWFHWASLTQLLHTHPWGLWACHQSPTLFACIALGLLRLILTFFSHHTLPMGLPLTIFLFPCSFKLICFLKAHLLISWICDPLFLPLGLNGFLFSVSCQFLSVAELGFLSYIWVSQKKTLNKGIGVF